MNLEISADQQGLREAFARYLDTESSIARVRAALPSGFDGKLWGGLAEFGIFSVRVPEAEGGLGLGLLDAAELMEEVGRTLTPGPVAEAVVAARLLALIGDERASQWLEDALAGRKLVTLAFQDLGHQPVQWIAGGAVADAVIARDGNRVLLIPLNETDRRAEANLASSPIAEIRLKDLEGIELRSDRNVGAAFDKAIEEWKILVAATLSGLSREAVRLAAAYAQERFQFGRPIGTYQGISHPMADLVTEIEGGKLLIWQAICEIAEASATASGKISLALWWNADCASRTVSQALQTFGGYGLTTEYDIHLYTVRAQSLVLTYGDIALLLEEAGRRLFGGERAELPDAGEVAIDFDLGDDARAFAAEVDTFFSRTLTPELKAKAHYSWEGHDSGVQRRLAEARLLFPSWPSEYGGRNASPYAVKAAQEVWEDHGWSLYATLTTQMIGTVIDRFGSDTLKREVLSKIASGESICSLGFSEPSSGSDVFAAQCRATRDGDVWRIDGQKMFTSGADLADYVLLLTRTDPEAAKHKGLTMFIVPLKASGVEVQPVHTFQDERTNITYYDGVTIPDSYRLGEVNSGASVMAAALELEHGASFATTQAMMLAAAERVCRETIFGGRPLIERTSTQARLARTCANTAVARVLALRAVWAVVENKSHVAYGPMSKLFSSEAFLSDARDLLSLVAPASLSKRAGDLRFLNECYRLAHGTRIWGGTSQVHRSLIAERFLQLPRSRGA